MVLNLASTISDIFESVAFLIIGVSVFGLSYKLQSIGFPALIFNFFIILLARFVNITVISLIINLSKIKHVNSSFKTVMWFSGLRGAMGWLISICYRYIKLKEQVWRGIFSHDCDFHCYIDRHIGSLDPSNLESIFG
jgi:NhaP-type Na+/H+ or K+/H+ antiporter